MSTAELDPISRACRLLREGAAELKNCHTPAATGHDWTGEPEAKAAYDEHMATADALERWADSIGAGGVESLRGRQCLHRISEPAGEYPPLPEPDTRWRAQWAGHGVSFHSEDQIIGFANGRARAAVDADRAMRAAQPAGAQQPGAAYAALPDDREAFKTYLKECDECAIVPDVAGAFNAAWQIASHGHAPARADMQDAYVGAREDLAIWKRRALEAERDLRAERETASRLAAEINAINGPTHLGEPAPTAQPAPAPTPQADSQPVPVPDMTVMQLAESVGLIGPASRTHDLHAAIQRFHDLICANATIKAAQMAAEAISEAAPQQEAQEPVAWQSRTRPTWGGDNSPWSPWEPCTKGQAEDYWKTPLLHDWAYEARALYTVPQTLPASQGYALVPVEPTPEMLSVMWVNKNSSLSEAYNSLSDAYSAMLAASPQPVVVREAFHKDTGCTPGGDINLAERVCRVVEHAHGITPNGRKDAP